MGCELIDALVAGRKGEMHRDHVGVRLMASRAVGADVGPCVRGARVFWWDTLACGATETKCILDKAFVLAIPTA